MMNVIIGADPEVFLRNSQTGELISAAGLFPGTKDAPFKVDRGAVQVDGMAAEYNIDPAKNEHEFVYNNLRVLQQLRNIIQERNPGLEFEFEFSPVAHFGADYIAAQPEENRILGCTPDYDTYTGGAPNPAPNAEMPFRTASGHIHLGWGDDYDIKDAEHIEACCMMSKQLDYSVGMWSTLLEGEAGKLRRSLYGKAGAFRPKKYGVEYRTMSNCWLTNTVYMQYVFNMAQRAFDELIAGGRYDEYYKGILEAQEVINNHDTNMVSKFFMKPVNRHETQVKMASLDRLVDKWKDFI